MLYSVPMKQEKAQEGLTEGMRAALAAAGRLGGRSRSERKAAAGRVNASKATAARGLRPLSAFACTCPAGAGTLAGHRAYCPLGRAIKRRGLG